MMRQPVPWRFPTLAALGMLACLAGPACRPDPRAERGGDSTSGKWKPGEEWRLVPEARIGSAEGSEANTFAMVAGYALDDLDRVWVVDAQQQNLRVFDRRGVHLRTIGRRGSGPEEFRWISGIARRPDGTLLVLDTGNSRFAVYDTAGALVATRPRNPGVSVTPWPGRVDSRGRLYDVGMTRPLGGGDADALVRFDSAFQPVDTFRLPPFEEQFFEISRKQDRNRQVDRVRVPFSASRVWRIDPEGHVWIALTDRYRFERHTFGGRVDRVVEREVGPVRVTAAERRAALGSNEDFAGKGGRIDASRIPDTKPALVSFFFDDRGRLWAEPELAAGETPGLDVFEPTGEYLGRVRLPLAVLSDPAPLVQGDRMVAVTTDRDGVQSVVVMRIERPSP
jgi:sugar lactone lactonase YvrE